MAIELRVMASPDHGEEILPDWANLTFGQDMLGPGALAFSYPREGLNAGLLQHGSRLKVLLDGVEPDNGRFTFTESEGSELSSEGGVLSYGCGSDLARFSELRLAPAIGSTNAVVSDFTMVNKTFGFMVRFAIENSRSRSNSFGHNPTWFTYPLSFTDTVDSSGNPWAATYDATWTSGTTVLEVLEWGVTNGIAEPRMVGDVLRLVQPEFNGVDRSADGDPGQVVLQIGSEFTQSNYQATSRELITALLVIGANDVCTWVYDTAAMAEHGYREGTISFSSIGTVATLQLAGQAYLDQRKFPRYSYTYEMSAAYLDVTGAEAPKRPFIDYQVADTILLGRAESYSPERVRMLSATWPSSRSATVAITLNDFFAERDLLLERAIAKTGLTV